MDLNHIGLSRRRCVPSSLHSNGGPSECTCLLEKGLPVENTAGWGGGGGGGGQGGGRGGGGLMFHASVCRGIERRAHGHATAEQLLTGLSRASLQCQQETGSMMHEDEALLSSIAEDYGLIAAGLRA